MADLIRLADDSDIEAAASELTEGQRHKASTAGGLDRRARALAILDFVQEILVASASGDDTWDLLYSKSCELLSSTVDVMDIMRTLRELIAEDSVSTPDVFKQETEAIALIADEGTQGTDMAPSNGVRVSTLGARKQELEEASSVADALVRGAEEAAFLAAAAVYRKGLS